MKLCKHRTKSFVVAAVLASLVQTSPAAAQRSCPFGVPSGGQSYSTTLRGQVPCVGAQPNDPSAVALGSNANTGEARAAVAVGADSSARGDYATALGTEAFANGPQSAAIGAASTSSAQGSVAIGSYATATAVNSAALGSGASSTAQNSIALGANSQAREANTVSVGSAGSERRVANVAAGLSSTDAVNLSQLNDVGRQVDELFERRADDRREMREGIASALAMGSAPLPSAPGRTSYVANAATYRGQQAIGVSVMHRLNTEKPFAVGFGISGGRKNSAAKVGVAGEF